MADKLEIQLLDSALNGDIASFGRLCEKYYNSMTAIAYSVLCDHHLAEDAAQEAFARTLVNLRKLKSKEKFGLWLARICRNVAKDMARTKSRNVIAEDLSQQPAKTNSDNSSRMVRQAINKLPSSKRELIVLRYYNNMSHEQLSNVLGLSKPAVNNRLHRARREIARYLQNNGFAEVEL